MGYIVAHFVAEGMAGPEVRGGEELPGQTAAPVGDEALLGQLPARERGIPERLPGEADMIYSVLQGKTNLYSLSMVTQRTVGMLRKSYCGHVKRP